ncbi:SCAN domain-containing protein 1-like [Anguilla anguilla]|uniref:SCAN domain-containing protein 1-like n=1 Tax=Anguilla anguilla TaxID=7936 RepID=UPI0015AC3FA8|nr:SCAN domain-containing protein 1-like [Anguilla anguilla]XP_035259539.1 SCAN domain-containing protein 1-like [Anguilla anguilla]
MEHSPEQGETTQPVVALARMLEGMAAMQERQTALHAEQLEALRAQTSLQTQALLQLAAAGETSSRERQTGSPVALHIPKMTPDDDAEAFLEGFEVAARACRWPEEEWVVRLLPLLTGEAQQAAHSLPPTARAEYANLRKAVLDCLGYSPEEHRRRFRETALAGEDRPFAYAQRLLDMARRWLRPELRSADGVVELVTLERFIDGLPGETANWVRCHRPTGLAAAVTLAEDHLALYPRG